MKPESAFSRPHQYCQHPELWTSPDSESTECEISELVGAFVRGMKPKLVVETGTAYGYTALEIGRALKMNDWGDLYTLEIHEGRLDEARKLLSKEHHLREQGGRVHLIAQSSLEFNPPGEIEFAWFDSLYELRVDEFLRFRKMNLLKPGTIVGFHDWTSGVRGHYMDVRKEVTERLVKAGYINAIFVPSPRGAVFAEVIR